MGEVYRKVQYPQVGDRVTITGLVVDTGTAGFQSSETGLGYVYFTDDDDDMVLLSGVSGVEVTVERKIRTTGTEPTGRGAVVRTIPCNGYNQATVYVHAGTSSHSWVDSAGACGVAWAKVLSESLGSVVELLSEGVMLP